MRGKDFAGNKNAQEGPSHIERTRSTLGPIDYIKKMKAAKRKKEKEDQTKEKKESPDAGVQSTTDQVATTQSTAEKGATTQSNEQATIELLHPMMYPMRMHPIPQRQQQITRMKLMMLLQS